VLFVGLCIAQFLATIHVYLSNTDLYRKLAVIRESGYLVVPNLRIMGHLQELGPAFFGGLFFTLSVGAGLSIGTLAAVWGWDRLLSRNRFFLTPFLLIWTGCLVGVNLRGFCPIVTLYFVAIPLVVFTSALRWMPPHPGEKAWLNCAIKITPIILLALVWAPHLDTHIFLKLRDNFLLSNSIGTTINDFYYKYSLYPAEAFKSLDQKMLKTCSLGGIEKRPIRKLLAEKLLNHDYLVVGGGAGADLEILQDGNDLVFENEGRPILRASLDGFLSRRGSILREFSKKSDKYLFFRRFTFFSLLIGLPITLYIFLHAILYWISGLFIGRQRASSVASALCLLAGIAVYMPFHQWESGEIGKKDLARALESKDWKDRVRALRLLCDKGMEVSDLWSYKEMIRSPYIPERYWLARALGLSKRPETYADILALLDDPHPNVVSMAFYALGQRGGRRVIEEIIKRIEISNDWYPQWYAYKALRSLGWKQTRSK
jgi:hypothetical protein